MQPPSSMSRPDRRWNAIVVLFLAIVVVSLGAFFYWFYLIDQGFNQFELEGLWEVKEVQHGLAPEKAAIEAIEVTRSKLFAGKVLRDPTGPKLGERKEMGSFVVDAKKKTIDLTPPAGDKGAAVFPGLYAIAGNELTLCFPHDPAKGRPAQIEKGPDYFTIVASRVKP